MRTIINGKFIVPDAAGAFTAVEGKALLYDEATGKITDIVDAAGAANGGEVIDAGGAYVSPGFVNVHIHGCVGSDTMDDDAEALPRMQKFLATTGVTAFLPTTMTYDFPTIGKAIDHVRAAMKNDAGAKVLGCHMEGPFINVKMKGAQAAKDIVPADFEKIAPFAGAVKIITIAPEELNGDYTFIEQCRKAGIVVSLGHSNADYSIAREAFKAGATHITHLYNAMGGLHHRKENLSLAALDTEGVRTELITDNVHVCPAMQRLTYKMKGLEGVVLITDSMRACGLADGPSELGGQQVFVKGTKATLTDGTIAGSVLKMNDGVRIFAESTGASITEVVTMATKTPAVELGVYDELGSLEAGKSADIVIFDEGLNIKATIVAGKTVYQA